jgi:hypothetical protein
MGEHAGMLCGHGAAELAHHALGEVVGVDQLVAHQAHERHLQPEIAADHPRDQALMREMA